MAQITGRATIRIGGAHYKTKAGATLTGISGLQRESVLTDQGVAGYKEQTVAPGLQCVIPHHAGISIKDIAGAVDVTITARTDSGVTFSMSPGWATDVNELNTESGDISCTFEGESWEELR